LILFTSGAGSSSFLWGLFDLLAMSKVGQSILNCTEPLKTALN